MAKGQGLPLEFIVIAAISVLIIVLVVAFTIGGLGSSFKQISITGGGDDLSTVQSACQTACNQFQANPPTSVEQFQSSNFCKKTYSVDINKNNKIDAGETGLKCYNQSINSDCNVQLANGQSVTGTSNCKTTLNQKCIIDQVGSCQNATTGCTSGADVGSFDCAAGYTCCA